jgi:hypothetical protein
MHAVSLHFMYYNLCRAHQTLTKAASRAHGARDGPGVANHAWKIEESVALLD